MTDISSLIDRVRFEIGDLGKSFAEQIKADGTTNRFQLSYNPINASSVVVTVDGVDVSSAASAEETTGVIVLDDIPEAGSIILVNGTHYRYFTNSEVEGIVNTAVAQHTAKRTDALGRTITVANLSTIDEHPVAVYASTLALYTLATDASFDIDIMAPDGVSIPRSERYRQLMEMIQVRQQQYKDLCVQLGIGMYSIDVFTFRRISKTTNRYVPVYKPQEVDDRSFPQRAELPLPTYGDANIPWVTEDGQLLAYQDRAWADTVTFTGDYTGYGFLARLVIQRGSIQKLQSFALDISTNDGVYYADLALSRDQTLRLPNKSWWSIVSVDPDTNEEIEIIGGDFIVRKINTSIL